MLRSLWHRFRRTMAAAPASADWTRHLVERFVHHPHGAEYGVTEADRRQLVAQFQEINAHVTSGTSTSVHVTLAASLLDTPKSMAGVAVECGAWKGASSSALSLVCALTGRTLWVCDSFEGLPDEGGKRHIGLHTGVYGHYEAGMFAGSLPEVRANIEQWGRMDHCEFLPGFFAESLGGLPDAVAFAFLDVDLEASTRDCLRHLWPRLGDGAYLYADDAGDLDVVKAYFDEPWWREHLGCAAPGFVGSGCGLPLSPEYSALGYTRKIGDFRPEDWRRVPFLHYPDDPKED